MFLTKVMKIGNVTIKGKLVLAPMAAITTLPFRVLCKRQGAGLVYTEMINLNALVRNNKATEKMCLVSKEEKPISIQLFGSREEIIKKSIEKIEDVADIIDFNLGCPASQIVSQGSGAALLKRPQKIAKIVQTLVKHSSKPVTVKMRLGYDKNNAVELVKIIEANGADAVAIHARTFKQGYTGKADWNAIKEVKEKVNIPVIGNGDVRTPQHAQKLLEFCDAVMVGRAAVGDPMIFNRIEHYLKDETIIPLPKIDSKIDLFLEYYDLAKEYDLVNLHTLQQRAQEFMSNIRNSSKIRLKINSIKNVEELLIYMKELKKDYLLL